MRTLIVGSGGREHAIAWKLRQSPQVSKVFAAPGNPGIAAAATLVPLKVDQLHELKDFALREKIDLTVVGPEYPLSLGIVDIFKEAGLRIFGPSCEAAKLESSKAFAKEVMIEAGVDTADHEVFTDKHSARAYLEKRGAPIVLKADGLAAGKGVYVCQTLDEALSAVDELYQQFPATKVVIEDYLDGKEVSYIVATDGERVVPFAASHDYKRIFDGDKGPNTGGMGTVCPTPNLKTDQESEVIEKVIRPVLKVMKKRGVPFCGFLYAGLMLTKGGSEIKVLEFNARLGDPETQVILRRMEGDLFETLYALAGASESKLEQRWSSDAAVCVVLASDGYPAKASNGDEISGIEQAQSLSGVQVFHAGTALNSQNRLVTNGGRVLNVTASGKDIAAARALAYRACDMIQFRGRQLRRDIAK